MSGALANSSIGSKIEFVDKKADWGKIEVVIVQKPESKKPESKKPKSKKPEVSKKEDKVKKGN